MSSDVEIPLQGAYVAKRCVVRAQNDILEPGERVPMSAFHRSLADGGNDHEDDIFARILASGESVVAIDNESAAATLDAMARGVSIILGGQLPPDLEGRRVGKPDVLVRAPAGGYRPVDVKWHGALQERGNTQASVRISRLEALSLEHATASETETGRRNEDDVIQLAHYQAMLEACGHAATDGRWGAIIGSESVAVWTDLDEPMWKTRSTSRRHAMRSTMERYHFEFAWRLTIIGTALRHRTDPSIPLLVEPVRIGECQRCPWQLVCADALERGSGDPSLVPGVSFEHWRRYRDAGILDRAGLAALDYRTARLAADGVDVAQLLDHARTTPAAAHIADTPPWHRRRKQTPLLAATGIHTFGDAADLCERTAAFPGGALPGHIDHARAALGPEPVYRRRGVDEPSIPRADVEIDIDMESVGPQVYLWGALVTTGGTTAPYRAFATWEPLTDDVELANGLAFWNWLTEVRGTALANGQSVAVYCYHAPAETTALRRIGDLAGTRDEIDAFIASGELVDMRRVFGHQFITGGATGLKAVATHADFAWTVEDPGGAASMLEHAIASHPDPSPERDAARAWLLDYNQGDVEATLAVREWLTREAHTIPGIETLEPPRR